jgi:hypothetical protein
MAIKQYMTSKRVFIIRLIFFVLVICAGILASPRVMHKLTNLTPSGMSMSQLGLGTFPDVDASSLSPAQRRIVTVAKIEHAAQSSYLKYTDGNKEAWCSDFVSWVMRQSGVPLTNPNSNGWRIPGTLTLKDYYQSQGRFKSLASGYQPKVGDIVIYDGAGWFGQHTNIVLANRNSQLTTVGGNENGKVRVQTKPLGIKGTIGYGQLMQ